MFLSVYLLFSQNFSGSINFVKHVYKIVVGSKDCHANNLEMMVLVPFLRQITYHRYYTD